MQHRPDTSFVHEVLTADEIAQTSKPSERRHLRPEAVLAGTLADFFVSAAAREPARLSPEQKEAFLRHNREQEKPDPNMAIRTEMFERFAKIMTHYLSLAADLTPVTYTETVRDHDRPLLDAGLHEEVAEEGSARLKQAGLTGVGIFASQTINTMHQALDEGWPREQILRVLIETMTMLLREPGAKEGVHE